MSLDTVLEIKNMNIHKIEPPTEKQIQEVDEICRLGDEVLDLQSENLALKAKLEKAKAVIDASSKIIDECWHEVANKSPSLGSLYNLHKALSAIATEAQPTKDDVKGEKD